MKFVESKSLDWCGMQAFLSPSAEQNHWTNFGPASKTLEQAIAGLLSLSPEKTVITTSSGTSALFALVGACAGRAHRPLRWLGSAFGFASTRIGPLADIRLVDCDENGLLDLDAADRIPADEWDGMIVTNVFGRCASVANFSDFCAWRGKEIIVDNAQCLLGYDRSGSETPAEIISFHHTKPWGFGEGGCAIVGNDDEDLLRRLLNFGYGAAAELGPFASNGKMSDVAAATILCRLKEFPGFAAGYQHQWQRTAGIASDLGFRVFFQPPAGSVIGFVPLLAPMPISKEVMHASRLPMVKYYLPLAPFPNARRLYSHMVGVASHPGMASIDDATLSEELGRLICI